VTVLTAAIANFHGVWRPSGIAGKIEKATG
jgi:hypothetical protein